jgi:hypothetical protein
MSKHAHKSLIQEGLLASERSSRAKNGERTNSSNKPTEGKEYTLIITCTIILGAGLSIKALTLWVHVMQ